MELYIYIGIAVVVAGILGLMLGRAVEENSWIQAGRSTEPRAADGKLWVVVTEPEYRRLSLEAQAWQFRRVEGLEH